MYHNFVHFLSSCLKSRRGLVRAQAVRPSVRPSVRPFNISFPAERILNRCRLSLGFLHSDRYTSVDVRITLRFLFCYPSFVYFISEFVKWEVNKMEEVDFHNEMIMIWVMSLCSDIPSLANTLITHDATVHSSPLIGSQVGCHSNLLQTCGQVTSLWPCDQTSHVTNSGIFADQYWYCVDTCKLNVTMATECDQYAMYEPYRAN
jgi:hypothetical protein